MAAKKHYLFPFNNTTWRHWNKVELHYIEPQGPPLSAKVSFVRIDPADQKLPKDNQGHVKLSIFCQLLYTSVKILRSGFWLIESKFEIFEKINNSDKWIHFIQCHQSLSFKCIDYRKNVAHLDDKVLQCFRNGFII